MFKLFKKELSKTKKKKKDRFINMQNHEKMEVYPWLTKSQMQVKLHLTCSDF